MLAARQRTKVAHPFRGVKTVDESEGSEHEVEPSDRPLGGADVPAPSTNDDRTEIGDPMSKQYNKGSLHNHPSHVTGTGGGPRVRSQNRSKDPREWMIQDYIKFTAKAANTPPAAPSTSTLFDENGVPKSHLPHNPTEHNLPQTEHHRTLPYEVARRGSQMLINNPLTRFANNGPWHGALAGAGAAAGLGMLGTGAYNLWKGFKDKDEEKLPFWKTVLLTSLAGAGLGALRGHIGYNHHPMSPKNKPIWQSHMKEPQAAVSPPPKKKVPTFQPTQKRTTTPVVKQAEESQILKLINNLLGAKNALVAGGVGAVGLAAGGGAGYALGRHHGKKKHAPEEQEKEAAVRGALLGALAGATPGIVAQGMNHADYSPLRDGISDTDFWLDVIGHGKLHDFYETSDRNRAIMGGGALLGGVAGGFAGHHLKKKKEESEQEKQAFVFGGGDGQAMIQSLQGSGLPFSLVEKLTAIIAGLSPGDARALRMAAGGAGGAALGIFLAKKFGLGGLLTAGLGLAGGLTGARMFGGHVPRRQQLTDLYGTPF